MSSYWVMTHFGDVYLDGTEPISLSEMEPYARSGSDNEEAEPVKYIFIIPSLTHKCMAISLSSTSPQATP